MKLFIKISPLLLCGMFASAQTPVASSGLTKPQKASSLSTDAARSRTISTMAATTELQKPAIINSHDFWLEYKNGTYTDTKPGSDNTWVAFYFVEDKPLLKGDHPVEFKNIQLPDGAMLTLRKLMMRRSAYPSWSKVVAEWWKTNVQNGGPDMLYNAQVFVRTPVKPKRYPGFRKLELENWMNGSWSPAFDRAPDVRLPEGKIAAVCTLPENMKWERAKEKGLTHLYRNDNLEAGVGEKKWTLLANQLPRSTTCQQDGVARPHPSENDIINAANSVSGGRFGFTGNDIVTDEFTDSSQSICVNEYWTVAGKFYRQLAKNLKATPETCNIMGGYMGDQNELGNGLFGLHIGGSQSFPEHTFFSNSLATPAQARLKWNAFEQKADKDHPFFQQDLQKHINLLTQCYVGMGEPEQDHFIYSRLFEAQKKYMAGIRRTVFYMSPWSQSVNWATDVQWKNSGYVIPIGGKGDYWRIKEWHLTPTYAMESLAFYSLLLAEGWGHFDSLRFTASKDPAQFGENPFAQETTWVSSNKTPAPKRPAGGGFPCRPLLNVDMCVQSTHWYAQVTSITKNAKVEYVAYQTDGKSVGIVKAEDPSVITASNLNAGQTTILKLAAEKRGLLLGAKAGGKWFLAYFNPYLAPVSGDGKVQAERIVAKFGGQNIDLGNLSGRKLHVFLSN